MKIVVLDGYTLNPGDLSWDSLKALGDVTIYDRTPKELIIERAKDAQVLLVNKTPLDQETLMQLPKCQYIGAFSTGYNTIDINQAKKQHIVVTNIPGYSTKTVAQHTFALLLECTSLVGRHAQLVKAGKWQTSTDFTFYEDVMEIAGKTLGIIGYGAIGKQVAIIGKAFGCELLIYDKGRTNQDGIGLKTDLATVLKQSDFISLHVPLNTQTQHLINKETLALTKDGLILINTARGALVDEEALLEALNSGKVKAAGLDVLAVEPPKANHPLIDHPKTIITPHMAWAAKAARLRCYTMAVDNLEGFIKGTIKNQVNQ